MTPPSSIIPATVAVVIHEGQGRLCDPIPSLPPLFQIGFSYSAQTLGAHVQTVMALLGEVTFHQN